MKKTTLSGLVVILLLSLNLVSSSNETSACSAVQFELTAISTQCSALPVIPTTIYIDPNSCLENSCSGSAEYIVEIRNAAGNVVFSQEAVNYALTFNPCEVLRVPGSGCTSFTVEVSFYCNGAKVAGSSSSQIIQVCA